jgi:hypothetical protein
MKRTTILAAMLLMCVTAIHKNVTAQCVQCDANSSATGNFASVIGMSTSATAQGAFAGGFGCVASGALSFSSGNHNIVDGTNSVAIGRYLQTGATPAMVLGTGGSFSEKLTNNISNSFMIGFNSNKPTLFIGGAIGSGYTGKIGIGDITNPQSKLHIKADNLEAAELYLEPYQFGVSTGATLWLGTKQYGVRATYGKLEFKTGDNGSYVFNEGNVGIGTTNPSQKLQVIGNIMTSGFIMTGGAAAGKVLTSDASGQAAWQVIPEDGHWFASGDNLYRLNGNVGIGTANPSQKLEVNGNLRTTGFIMPTGAASGRVLTSNASGTATWSNPQWTTSGSNIYRLSGSVGIGMLPSCKLEVNETIKCGELIGNSTSYLDYFQVKGSSANNAANILLGSGGTGQKNLRFAVDGGNFEFYTKSSGVPYQRLTINNQAFIVGTPSANYNMKLYGKLDAKEIEIYDLTWPDFVFKNDYNLITIEELESYILLHGHLPGIPSEKYVMENGIRLGEITSLLLLKIEELTLYLIDLKKRNDALLNEILSLKTENDE